MTDLQFESCIRLMIDKDRNGLKDIYTAYAKQIYRVILGIVRSHEDAEDLTSDFFLKLWNMADSYKSGQGHKRWLTVIARNLALDHLRKQHPEQLDIDSEDGPAANIPADGSLENSVSAKLTLEAALSQLSLAERQIVEMKLGMELTFREIARTLGEPQGTVAWRYDRAVSKLKKIMEEEPL